jgi:hypothetical protein
MVPDGNCPSTRKQKEKGNSSHNKEKKSNTKGIKDEN